MTKSAKPIHHHIHSLSNSSQVNVVCGGDVEYSALEGLISDYLSHPTICLVPVFPKSDRKDHHISKICFPSMGSVGNTVSYCCIWKKGGRVLYNYKSGDHEIANLASSCLEMTPPYHRWYFQTTGKHTFGFLIDNGYVYFTIVYESLGNSHVLSFLQKLRDEFGRVDKRGSTKTLDSLCLQEQLFPVVLRLVASLEQHVEEEWPKSSNGNSTHVDDGVTSSTKAPLLGKPSKQDKKKMKGDHAVVAIEMEEHRRSTDRGIKIDHGASSSSSQLTRINKSSSQNLHRKWCRRVWIVLAIDAAVCVVLFIIWLIVCHGTDCIR